jgi:hypothetical protein
LKKEKRVSKLESLLKKRDELERKIQEVQAQEKRGQQIARLAIEAGIVDLTDDEIVAGFRKMAAAKGRMSAPAVAENPPS